MGADAVEPDVVATRDGVLVIRHENEISGTTDVADRPEFADRRSVRTIDGVELEGWFTEDFAWAELATLRCRERLSALRPESAAHDGEEPILMLAELLDLAVELGDERGRPLGVVLEIKHATYFEGLGLDLAALAEDVLRAAGWAEGAHPLVVESFELGVLQDLRRRGIPAEFVYLVEAEGAPADLVAELGAAAPTYREQLRPEALAALARHVEGVSVDKTIVLDPDRRRVVADAHAAGLRVFTWTCRPENAFLDPAHRRGDDRAAYGDFRSEWALIRDAGLDGVFVDHPDLGVEVFGTAREGTRRVEP